MTPALDYSRPSMEPGASAWPAVAIYSAAQAVIGFCCLCGMGIIRFSIFPPAMVRVFDIAASQYWIVVALCAVYCGSIVASAAGIVCILQWRSRGGEVALKIGIITILIAAAAGGLLFISGH